MLANKNLATTLKNINGIFGCLLMMQIKCFQKKVVENKFSSSNSVFLFLIMFKLLNLICNYQQNEVIVKKNKAELLVET